MPHHRFAEAAQLLCQLRWTFLLLPAHLTTSSSSQKSWSCRRHTTVMPTGFYALAVAARRSTGNTVTPYRQSKKNQKSASIFELKLLNKIIFLKSWVISWTYKHPASGTSQFQVQYFYFVIKNHYFKFAPFKVNFAIFDIDFWHPYCIILNYTLMYR